MQTLDSIFVSDGSIDPDWSFQPYSRSIRLGDGQLKGQGFPIAKWRWNGLSDYNRETLRDFVGSNLSATVFIRTATNETNSGDIVYKNYEAIMNWSDQDEDFQIDKVLGLILVFTHLVLQS
jgi:hypothetical protein